MKNGGKFKKFGPKNDFQRKRKNNADYYNNNFIKEKKMNNNKKFNYQNGGKIQQKIDGKIMSKNDI